MGIYKFVAKLTKGFIFDKYDQEKFFELAKNIDDRRKTRKIQKNYNNVLNKIRKKYVKNEKINVLFLVNEISKWKYKALYDTLENSKEFNPIIAITIADIQTTYSQEEQKECLIKTYNYFNTQGYNCDYAWDVEKNIPYDLKKFDPDFIFYQQPYCIAKPQCIEKVSKYALTCYVPYSVSTYCNYSITCDKLFHKRLFRYFVVTSELANEYKERYKQFNETSEHIYGVGHPMIDNINNIALKEFSNEEYVIYAPHWSITHKKNNNILNMSTFDTLGNPILEFAKAHPEIKWVFKPHPSLKIALKKIGWGNKEIDNYYGEWESFAKCCYDANYIELFFKSKLLITDCGSFLPEYFCTKNPIILLVSSHNEHRPFNYLKNIFKSFYKAEDNESLKIFLNDILINNLDTKKDMRLKIYEEVGFNKYNASNNIIQNLYQLLIQEENK